MGHRQYSFCKDRNYQCNSKLLETVGETLDKAQGPSMQFTVSLVLMRNPTRTDPYYPGFGWMMSELLSLFTARQEKKKRMINNKQKTINGWIFPYLLFYPNTFFFLLTFLHSHLFSSNSSSMSTMYSCSIPSFSVSNSTFPRPNRIICSAGGNFCFIHSVSF